MNFLQIDNEKLIFEVHLRPTIWDTKSNDYSNKIRKQKAWEEITNIFAEEMATVKEKQHLGYFLQKRWMEMRDRFIKEINEENGISQQLEFLKHTCKNKRKWSSSENSDTSPPSSPSPFPKSRQTSNSIEEKIVEVLELTLKKTHNTDDVDLHGNKLFLLSLLPFLNSLSPSDMIAARIALMQVMEKFNQMANHQHSVTQTQGPSPPQPTTIISARSPSPGPSNRYLIEDDEEKIQLFTI